MSVVEKAVIDLANALDALESKLDSRLDDQMASSEDIDAARRQAKAAKARAEEASKDLGEAIADVKALLEANA